MQFSKKEKEKFSNKLWRLENLYKIQDLVSNQIINLKLNQAQLSLFNSLQSGHKKEIVLKARQLGVTTFYLMYMLDSVLWNENYIAGVIAHKDESAVDLFKKIKLAFDNFPLIESAKKKILKYSESELMLSTGSSISVSLSYRSGTLNHLHVSELAKMSRISPIRAEEVITGAFPAAKNGIITVESTAEGIGGYFWELWNNAPNNGFNKHFFPWWEDKNNCDVSPHTVPPLFREIQKYYKLTDEQISWYHNQYLIYGAKLAQEFPCNAEESFLQSGRPVFNSGLIARCSPDTYRVGHVYSAGIDTAVGSGKDWSVLTIINKVMGRQVMTYRSQEPIPVFATRAIEILNSYRDPLLNIELNGVGIAMKQSINAQGYENLYLEKVKYDQSAQEWTDREGTYTTNKNKPLMIEQLRQAIEHGFLKISDEQTYNELIAIQYDESDKINAPIGSNDDTVIALALAYQASLDVDIPIIQEHKEFTSKFRPKSINSFTKISKGIY